MRVFVAGDRGYLGTVVVPFLRRAGHHMVGLDAGWYDGSDFGPVTRDYEQRTGDIRDARIEELQGFDAAINLAAVSNDLVGHLNSPRQIGSPAIGRPDQCALPDRSTTPRTAAWQSVAVIQPLNPQGSAAPTRVGRHRWQGG